jgi:hypothetical protein
MTETITSLDVVRTPEQEAARTKFRLLHEELANRIHGAIINLNRRALLEDDFSERARLFEKTGFLAIFLDLHVHNVLMQRDASEVRAYLRHLREDVYGGSLPSGMSEGLNSAIQYVEEYLR